MVVHLFASHPSDPLWEKPRYEELHVHTLEPYSLEHDGGKTKAPVGRPRLEDLSERAKALHDATFHLTELCATNATLSEIHTFFATWEDPSSPGRLQPNALAWFNDTTALYWAGGNNNPKLMRLLLSNGLQPDARAVRNTRAKMRETKDSECLKLLVDSGWKINEPLDDHTPPLMGLILDELELVQWCLALGADPNGASLSGNTVMQRATGYAPVDTLELLVQHGGRVLDGGLVAHASYLHTGGQTGRVEVVRFLLDHGAPIDDPYVDPHTQTANNPESLVVGTQNALHLAIGAGKKDMVQLLIDRGANKNTPGWSAVQTGGKTVSPVELARMHGYEDIAKLLESPDVDVKE